MKKLPIIRWGVVNPSGEDDLKSTYYFQKSQLPEVAKQLIGKPVKISHNHLLENGEEAPPSGIVVHAHVHSKTGQLWAAFITTPTPPGELAEILLGGKNILPPELCMQEMSLGFDILRNKQTGAPLGHIIKELSICYSGARPNCQIKGSDSYSIFLKNNKIHSKEITENINKYFLKKNNKEEFIKKEENIKESKKMMNKLAPAEAEVSIGRPKDAESLLDSMDMTINVPSSQNVGGVDIISAQASTQEVPSQTQGGGLSDDTQKQISEIMERALQNSNKRPREDDSTLPRVRLDFSKFVNGVDSEWKEPTMPEGLNETQQEAFREAYRLQRSAWEQSQQLAKENRRKFLERLQGATDKIIPTYVAQAAADNKQVDTDSLATILAGVADVNPMAAEQFVNFVEAQAKQNVSNQGLVKDINQLEKEYQTKIQKLAQENEELKKNQSRPPLVPLKQTTTQTNVIQPIVAHQQQQQQISLKEMKPFERIITQASMRMNQRNGNIPSAQLPVPLILENAKIMQKYWDKYAFKNPETANMGQVFGGSYKAIRESGGNIPGVDENPKWINFNDV